MLLKKKLMRTNVIVIDMVENDRDINREYEQLFGSARRVNLFDTEEEYLSLRSYILEQPTEIFDPLKLPFETIDLTFHNNRKNIPKKEIASIIKSIKIYLLQKNKKDRSSNSRHLFFIEEIGRCNASGYYEEETGYFYICKDSLVSYETDVLYLASDTENARINFIKKACREEPGYFRVIKDAKCRSASAAACYVLGFQVDCTQWKDKQGKTLSEIYPLSFLPIPEQEVLSKEETYSVETQNKTKNDERVPRYYYISRNMGDRSCEARGMYDKVNDKFIVMEGSRLATEVTSSYRYTASDIKRKKFIQLYCKDKYNNILKRDAICNSPNEAACFVLGENANGWAEWKSKDGISLESYINKVQT